MESSENFFRAGGVKILNVSKEKEFKPLLVRVTTKYFLVIEYR